MQDAPDAVPYEGATPHDVLDSEKRELVREAIVILEPVTPLPKKRTKRKAE